MSYLENDPNNFILVLKLNHVKKISRGRWSGVGTETVGIHPNEHGVLNGHPNKIPTSEMLGDVVQNCPLVVSHPWFPSLDMYASCFFISFYEYHNLHFSPQSTWCRQESKNKDLCASSACFCKQGILDVKTTFMTARPPPVFLVLKYIEGFWLVKAG